MRKGFKIILTVFFIVLIIISTFILSFFIVTAPYKLNKDKLIDASNAIEIYDKNNDLIETISLASPVTKIDKLNDYTLNAFIAVEDKRFYDHFGIDLKGIVRAGLKNIKNRSFVEGGSTISQQLIKNTHLSNEKTIKRKLIEVKLTLELEKNLTKEQILECYLNTIYFGKNIYGIENASRYYFNKTANKLSLSESAVLAGLIKSPNKYSPENNLELSILRRDTVLKLMLEQNKISRNEYQNAIDETINLKINKSINNINSFYQLCLTELDEISLDNPYIFSNIKIYTEFDKEMQINLSNNINKTIKNSNQKAILLDKNGYVIAYVSNVNDTSRQVGSTLKPFVSYAPAIDLGLIDTISIIKDEKTDFNGYNPSNYKDVYYGNVSAEFALAKSLNVPAVKLLNDVGIEKSNYYLKKFDIDLSEDDLGLSLALGATKKGLTLKKLTSLYGVFINNGYYNTPKTIKKITTFDNNTIYMANPNKTQIYSEETAFLVNDMLSKTVEYGTGKKLQNKNFTIYAKTGTCGNKLGNTDAYTISYTKDYILGVWYGNTDGYLLDNNVTGGTYPALTSACIWDNIYKNKTDTTIKAPSSIELVKISKSDYERDYKIVLADDNAPKNEIINVYFNKNRIPKIKSDKYSNPKIDNIDLLFYNNTVKITYDLDEYLYFKLFKNYNGLKIEIFDSYNSNTDYFIDDKLKSNTVYSYTVLPYSKIDNKIIFGNEFLLKNVKTDLSRDLPNDWWLN